MKPEMLGAVGGAVSAGASLGSSLFNIFTQNSRNKAAAREQRLENERNRNFQREMAELAYQRNIEQWNRENEYNSPLEQRKRLQAAGLNADLFYGGGAGNMLSADSPQMSGSGFGGGAPASDAVGRGIPEFDTLAVERARAEIDNIKANTKSTEEDTQSRRIENYVQEAIKDNRITLSGLEISLSKEQVATLQKNREKADSEIRNLDSAAELNKALREQAIANISNIDADTAIKEIDAALREPYIRAQIQKFASEANLSFVQATDIVKTQSLRLLNLQADYDLKGEQMNLTGNMGFMFGQKGEQIQIQNRTENSLRLMQISTGYLNAANGVLGFFVDDEYIDSLDEQFSDKNYKHTYDTPNGSSSSGGRESTKSVKSKKKKSKILSMPKFKR